MDQRVAKKLFEEGAFLVLLDVPEKVEFGIDYNCWNVGPLFKGIKMILPGIHFVFYSAVSKEDQTAPRTGFFHFFQRQEILVKKWSTSTEELVDEGVNDDLVQAIRSNIKDLDRFLAPYPYETLKKWTSLTSYISQELMTRMQPINGKITSVAEFESTPYHSLKEQCESEMSVMQPMDEDHASIAGGRFAGVGEFSGVERTTPKFSDLAGLKHRTDSVVRFSEIPKQKYPSGASPNEITKCNMDQSYALGLMMSNLFKNVFDAFEHWKDLVKLLCSCEEALVLHKDLFSNFITVLHFELKEIPQDYFVDIVSKTNFLTTTLQNFFVNLQSSPSVDGMLVKKGMLFKENLTKTYKWDFDIDPEEFAPTVVDI